MEGLKEKLEVAKYPVYKDSGLKWIGLIPEDWEVKKLKYVLLEINERSETGEQELLSLSKSKGIVPKSSLGERAGQANTLVGYKKVYPESLVINKMQAVNGLLSVSKLFGITSPDYSVYKTQNSKFDINYFGYLLGQPEYLTEFKKVVTGVMEGFIRLYTDDLFNIKAHIPPISEQIEIVNFLDRKTTLIDQAIAIKQKQIELLKERRQILIHKAVTRGLNPDVKLKDSGVEWVGEIPEEWGVITKMKFISSLKGRQGWQGLKAEEYKDEGPHVLSSAHFNNYVIDWEKCPRVSLERYLMDKHIQLNIGDILLMKDGANMGKLAFIENLPGLACLNSHLLLFRSFSENGVSCYFPKFMFYHMMCNRFQDYVKINGTGSTFLGISQESIGNYPICLPPFEMQRVITDFLDVQLSKFDQSISLKEQEIEKLKEYKSTLINSAVTGKIKII